MGFALSSSIGDARDWSPDYMRRPSEESVMASYVSSESEHETVR